MSDRAKWYAHKALADPSRLTPLADEMDVETFEELDWWLAHMPDNEYEAVQRALRL